MRIQRTLSIFHSTKKQCTLLIPDHLMPYYKILRKKEGGAGPLLGVLLKKHSLKISNTAYKNNISSTLSYQKVDLHLHKVNFRPFEKDWISLKLFATAQNVSMCALFTIMVMMERGGLLKTKGEFGGVPTHPPKITLRQSLTFYSIPIFIRILHRQI